MTLIFPVDRSSVRSALDPITCPAEAFDAAFRHAAPGLDCRDEVDGDRDFLSELFVTCSPLGDVLPVDMLHHQAAIQYDAYVRQFPRAMRRVIVRGGEPVGRVVIDWDDEATQCVDIAVAPRHRGTGAGSAMLRAWLTVGDALGKDAWLSVLPGNPALELYARFGFVATPAAAPSPVVSMTRPIGGRSA